MAGAGQGGTGGGAGVGAGSGGQGGDTGMQPDAGGMTGAGGSPTDGPGVPRDGSADGAAVNSGGYIAGGGCDCSTSGDSTPLRLLAWVVVGVLGWVRRRRRPRR
jgi:MYXO-CTERM domain-containing protein